MKQVATQGIVLSRINYGEADRIITVLTADHGKIRLLAKGVRRIKSKLAGGIELFSVTDITYIRGKGDMGTLISSRLQKNFGHIVTDINRTMFTYDVLKQINKITQDSPEPEYFYILQKVLAAINMAEVPIEYIQIWLHMRLLRLGGYEPNLQTTEQGKALNEQSNYVFDFDSMAFIERKGGPYDARHIKLLRLSYATDNPTALAKVQTTAEVMHSAAQIVKTMYTQQGYM